MSVRHQWNRIRLPHGQASAHWPTLPSEARTQTFSVNPASFLNNSNQSNTGNSFSELWRSNRLLQRLSSNLMPYMELRERFIHSTCHVNRKSNWNHSYRRYKQICLLTTLIVSGSFMQLWDDTIHTIAIFRTVIGTIIQEYGGPPFRNSPAERETGTMCVYTGT